MPSGRVVFGTLVDRIDEVEASVGKTSTDIEARQAELEALRERKAKAYASLASFHLPDMSATAVAETLTAMADEVRAIYEKKVARTAELREHLPGAETEIASMKEKLARYTDELSRIGEERDRLEADVEAELRKAPDWPALIERLHTAAVRARAAERRHEVAVAERTEKLPAYERDAFFSYLLARNTGTPQAVGNALTRRIDAWVAEVTGYSEARADYDVLMELPDYTASLLEEERKILDEARRTVWGRTSPVADRLGLTAILEEGDRVHANREQLLAALRKAEEKHLAMQQELAAMDDEHGTYHRRALGELEEYLRGRSLDDLLHDAQATEDPRDDAIVGDLAEVEAALSAAGKDLLALTATRTTALEQLQELKALRHEFEKNDWNGARSSFAGGLNMNALLLGYMAGQSSAGDVRSRLHHHQHFAPRDTDSGGAFLAGGGFGSGGHHGGDFSAGGGFGSGSHHGGGGFSAGGGF